MRAPSVPAWLGETCCGLALTVTGVAFAFAGRAMSLYEDGVPGPGLVPAIIGASLAGLGLGIAFFAVRRRDGTDVSLFDRDSLLAALLMLAAILVFERVGYLITSFVFLWASFTLVGRQPALPAGLIAAAATLLSWAIFVRALGVSLPVGISPFY